MSKTDKESVSIIYKKPTARKIEQWAVDMNKQFKKRKQMSL